MGREMKAKETICGIGAVEVCVAALLGMSACSGCSEETAAEFMRPVAAAEAVRKGNPTMSVDLDLKEVFEGASAPRSTARVTDRGVEVRFAKYDGTDATKWAGFRFSLPDCTVYEEIGFTVAPDGGLYRSLTLGITDSRKFTYGTNHAASMDEAGEHLYSLREFEYGYSTRQKPFDPSLVKSATLYTRFPEMDSGFVVSRIRLISRLPGRLDAMATHFRQIGEPSLADEADALAASLRSGTVDLKAAHSRFVELSAVKSAKVRSWWRQEASRRHEGAAVAVGWIDGYEKVRPSSERFEDKLPRLGEVRTVIARNEREGVQILCLAPDGIAVKDLKVASTPLKGENGTELPEVVAAPVGRVTVVNTKGTPDAVGEHFDPICEFTNGVDMLDGGAIQAFHVRFTAAKDTPPGIYRGEVRISAAGGADAVLPVAVRVSAVSLPEKATLATASAVYGSKAMGKRRDEFMAWVLKNYRINPFSIYTGLRDMKPQLPPISQYLAAKEIGLTFLPIVYLMPPHEAYQNSPESRKKGAPAKWKDLPAERRARYDSHFRRAYLEILRRRVPELKAAGLWDISACYCFDESPAEEFAAIKDLVDAIREEFPDMKFISTMYDYGGYVGVDALVPTTDTYRRSVAKELRKRGVKVWYYTVACNIDRSTLAGIRAELGARAFALDVDGWLVWALTRWIDNKPISSADATGWNPESFPGLHSNGGGSYFAIASDGTFLPTLRAEAIRDGIEDHALFTLAKAAGATPTLPEDEAHVFTADEQRTARLAAIDALERKMR